MTYKIVSASVLGTTASLVLSTVEGLEVGASISVYKTGQPRLDKRHDITTINTDTKTITCTVAGGTIVLFNPPNASVVALVTWVNEDDVAGFLGFTPEEDSQDAEYLAVCTEAANDFGYRRREQAGYLDSKCLIPNASTPQGVVLYAAALFRERGSVDSFASFQDVNIQPMVGSMGQILRLLGVPRPAVG